MGKASVSRTAATAQPGVSAATMRANDRLDSLLHSGELICANALEVIAKICATDDPGFSNVVQAVSPTIYG